MTAISDNYQYCTYELHAVQNRACRYFLGFGRYAPNAAINGDMGWLSPDHSQWMSIARKWCRLVNMDESLLAKKIFPSHLDQGSTNCKIWYYRVKMYFIELSMSRPSSCDKSYIEYHTQPVTCIFGEDLELTVEYAVRGQDAGGNKLRTYKKFKENYDTEQYVKVITQKRYRLAYNV